MPDDFFGDMQAIAQQTPEVSPSTTPPQDEFFTDMGKFQGQSRISEMAYYDSRNNTPVAPITTSDIMGIPADTANEIYKQQRAQYDAYWNAPGRRDLNTLAWDAAQGKPDYAKIAVMPDSQYKEFLSHVQDYGAPAGKGFWNALLRDVKKGTISTIGTLEENAARALVAISPFIGRQVLPDEQNLADNIRAQKDITQAKNLEPPSTGSWWGDNIAKVAGMVPAITGGIGATAAGTLVGGPGGGAATGWGYWLQLTAPDMYRSYRDLGVPPTQAFLTTVVAAPIEAGFMQFGLGKGAPSIVGDAFQGVKKDLMKTVADRLLKGTIDTSQAGLSVLAMTLTDEGSKSIAKRTVGLPPEWSQSIAKALTEAVNFIPGLLALKAVTGLPEGVNVLAERVQQKLADLAVKNSPLAQELISKTELSRTDIRKIGIVETTSKGERDEILTELKAQVTKQQETPPRVTATEKAPLPEVAAETPQIAPVEAVQPAERRVETVRAEMLAKTYKNPLLNAISRAVQESPEAKEVNQKIKETANVSGTAERQGGVPVTAETGQRQGVEQKAQEPVYLRNVKGGRVAPAETKGVVAPEIKYVPPVPKTAPVMGKDTEVQAVGMAPVKAKYALMELSDLVASHDVSSKTPVSNVEKGKYPANLQPRSYAKGGVEEALVGKHAQEFVPGFLISNYPSADSGPPVVTPDGTVMNGNGRKMTLDLLNRSKKFVKQYKDVLHEQAADYGLTRGDVERMKRPVLVRVAEMDVNSPEAQRFATAGNVPTVASQSPTRLAASLNKLVSPEAVNQIRLEADTTFSETVNGSAGKDFRNSIYETMPKQEVDAYFTPDRQLTDAGKELVKEMLVTKIVPVELVERMGEERKALKEQIESIVPQLLKFKRDFPGQDPSPQLNEAIGFLVRYPRAKSVSSVENTLGQGTFLGREQASISSSGRMLLDFMVTNKHKSWKPEFAKLLHSLEQSKGMFKAEQVSLSKQMSEIFGVTEQPGAEFGYTETREKQTAISAYDLDPTDTFNKPLATVNTGDIGPVVTGNAFVDRLRSDLGTPVFIGGFKGKKRAGIYDKQGQLIRLKGWFSAEPGVAAHEAGHDIDDRWVNVRKLPQYLKKELVTLDYQFPEKRRSWEGFAEFIRKLVSEDNIKQRAPQFYDWFLHQFIPKNPQIGKWLAGWREMVIRLRNQDPEQTFEANISKTGRHPESAKGWFNRVSFALQKVILDKFVGLEAFVKAVNKERKGRGLPPLEPINDAYLLARVFSGSDEGCARQMWEKGVYSTKDGRKLAPAMTEITRLVPEKDLSNAVQFAFSRHGLDCWAAGRNPGQPRDVVAAVYNRFKDRKDFVAFADGWTAWNKGLVTMLAEVGGLTPDVANMILNSWPHYVPAFRMMETPETIGFEHAGAGPSRVRPVKRATEKGGGQPILDPMAMSLKTAVAMIAAVHDMQISNAIIKAGLEMPGGGRYVTKESLPQRPIQFEMERIKKQLEASGADLSDVEMSTVLTLFTNNTKYTGGEPIKPFVHDGKLEFYRLHPELYDACTNAGGNKLETFIRGLGLGARIPIRAAQFATKALRAGATGYRLSFGLMTNPERDIYTAMMQTKHNPAEMAIGMLFNLVRIPTSVIMKKLGYASTTDALRTIVDRFGGRMSGFVGQDISQVVNHVEELNREAYGLHLKDYAFNSLKYLEEVLSIPEQAPRLQEFHMTLKKAGFTDADIQRVADGTMPVTPKMMNAILQGLLDYAEVTVDFRRGGSLMQIVNRFSAYSNAQTQGVIQPYRRMMLNPFRFALRGFLTMTIPALLQWWRHKDQDWYKELPVWQKMFYWNFRSGDKVIRAPKDFGIGMVFGGIPEAIMDSLYGKEPTTVNDVMGQVLPNWESVLSGITPDIARPFLETIMNYDLYRRKDIVGQGLQRLEPKDQWNDYTTAAAKYFGYMFNVSPIKFDHLIAQYSGGLGTDLLRIPEEGPVKAVGTNRFSRGWQRGKSIDVFYEQLKTTEQQYNSAKLKKEVPPELESKYKLMSEYSGLMSDIRKVGTTVQDKDQRADLQKYVTGLARDAMGMEPLADYPSLVTAQNLPPDLQKIRDKFIGNKVVQLTDPPPRRERGETLDHFRTRRDAYQKSVTEVADYLTSRGLTDRDMLRTTLKRTGHSTPERLQRLNAGF